MKRYVASAIALVWMAACGIDPDTGSTQIAGASDPGGAATPPASCGNLGPPGSIVWSHVLGGATRTETIDVASDARGDAFAARGDAATGTGAGITAFTTNGDALYTFPFGSVVAADAAGHAFVAGSFTAAIAVGGILLVPQGNADVFLVELDRDGEVVFARALGLCGAGVESIAVDPRHRIAISGAGFGTVVLDRDGTIGLQLPFAGHVAFDSRGDLVVGGTFSTIDFGTGTIASRGAMDGFVVEVDRHGATLWSQILSSTAPTGTVSVNAIAVDPRDDVVIGGVFNPTVDLFGTVVTVITSPESGIVFDTFLAKLDPAGKPIWAQPPAAFPQRDLSGVASDRRGDAVASGADTGNTGLFRITHVDKLDPSGAGLWTDTAIPASGDGEGLGVATDACGAVYWGVTALDAPSPVSALRAYLVKLAP